MTITPSSRSLSQTQPVATGKANVGPIHFKDALGIQPVNELIKANRMTGSASVGVINARPPNMLYRLNNYSWWTQYAMMDFLRREVSIMDTLIIRSSTEIIKYGVDWEPKFKKKCQTCGTEYQQEMTVCRECGSQRLRKPEEKQKEYFVNAYGKSFLKEANVNGQTLKALLKSYIEMQYTYNEGGIIRVSADTLDPKDMSIESSRTLEFIAIDPKFRRMLFDETGEPGKMYGFTADDRKTLITINETEFTGYDEKGRAIYPAFWGVSESHGGTGNVQYYTKDEMFADKWFGQSLTYGTPVWMSILDDLYAYHYIEKHDLKRFAFGYARGLLVLPGFDGGDIQEVADGIHQTLATNDNSIPMIGIPRQIDNNAKLEVQFVPLGTDNAESTLKIKQDIRERLQAHVGTPNLMAGDTTSSGGMNNESQQLTMYDRFLVDKYLFTDDLLDWMLSWFPVITDWLLRVKRPMKSDSERRERQANRQEALEMQNLGYVSTEWVNGEFTFPNKPTPKDSGMGMMGGSPFGGGGGSFRPGRTDLLE